MMEECMAMCMWAWAWRPHGSMSILAGMPKYTIGGCGELLLLVLS